jgi:3-oxoadipate CoA-transferase alpha subunit
MTREKIVFSPDEAVREITEGSTVMFGGFGGAGAPDRLIDALADFGVGSLTGIANHTGKGEGGFARLLLNGQIRKMIAAYPFHRNSHVFRQLYDDGKIVLEIVPQGTLAERIRVAGAGIPAFFTPTGAGTVVAEGKEVRRFGDRECLLEIALHADFALIHAKRADRLGNLVYSKTGRNFNPIMAAAARMTIAEVEEIVETGDLDPESIVTPFPHVDRLVEVGSHDHRIN